MSEQCVCGEPLVLLVEHVATSECKVWIHEHPVPHTLCEGARPVDRKEV